MEYWINLVLQFLGQIPRFFLNPMLYIILLLLMLQYRREVLLQRRLFNSRVTSVIGELGVAMGRGILGALLITLLLFALGISFTNQDLLLLQGITVLLGFINMRYFHMGIGAGVLLILAYIAGVIPILEIEGLSLLQKALSEINSVSIAILAGLMFVMEGIWLGKGKREGFFPVIVDGKRGRVVGAYQIRRFSFYPMMVVLQGGSGFIPLPGIAGYTDLVKTGLPEEKLHLAQKGYWVIGLGVLGAAWFIPKIEALMLATGLWIFFANEGIRWIGRLLENKKGLFYGRVPKGVRVMDVIPNSPAAKMDIETGDVILKVNGVTVSHQNDIFPLLQRQTSFCKMEVLNKEGNIKYVHRSMYEGEPHGLGVVPAPDQFARQYVKEAPLSLFSLFSSRVRYLNERSFNQELGQGKDVSM